MSRGRRYCGTVADRRPSASEPRRTLLSDLLSDTAGAVQKPAGWKTLLLGLAWSRSAQAVALYRLANRAWKAGMWPVAEILQRIAQLMFCVDMSYRATAGPGLVLRHAMMIVIGADVVLGADVQIFQGVTLGKRLSGSEDRPDGMPVIGDGVVIGSGAAILGPVLIGAGAMIGANAVVTRDVDAGSVVSSSWA